MPYIFSNPASADGKQFPNFLYRMIKPHTYFNLAQQVIAMDMPVKSERN